MVPSTIEGKLTSTSVTESAVIQAPIYAVWRLVKLKKFIDFFEGIIKSETIHAQDDDNDDREIIRWTFEDGTVLDVVEEEYSTVKYYMSFNILKCEPWGLPYASVLSTIQLYPITSRSAQGATFVQWSGHYSADATAEVVQDGHVKRREALDYLARAVEKV
ncbi:uncharacterized protein FTOL_11148 [Fusarium torulosum]|uniref:Bet v1-like protein n=1 Tax=Fusarium torulosum TaxID=33205 RepID=A0AAE8MJC6_9HYPO|nr:uncharacterized protein FTOL_11148 [Fusarium torulosum]